MPVVIARRAAIKIGMMSSAEKSRLRSEKPEQRRGTEQQEHRKTGTRRSGEKTKKDSEDRKDSANQKMRRIQRQRKGETSRQVKIALLRLAAKHASEAS